MTVLDNELYHYGVKGMKWGVRKDRDSRSYKSKVEKKYFSDNQRELRKSD